MIQTQLQALEVLILIASQPPKSGAMIQTKVRICGLETFGLLSQPPKSGAMIQTELMIFGAKRKVMSQPPKSGAMIQTLE